MKDIKIRPLHHFLCLFADPINHSQIINNNSQQSTNNTQKSNRVLFQEKSQEWVMDGTGYKIIFLRILSFLDEYDLAQSVEPTCKLFRNFALCDSLWESLLWNFLKDKKWKQDIIEARLKTLEGMIGEPSWKKRLVRIVKMYYEEIGNEFITISTPGENGMWGIDCAECSAKIEHRDNCIFDTESGDNFHPDCFSKERFWECVENVNQCRIYQPWLKKEFIDLFFKRRMVGEKNHNDEEDYVEEELPEFSCDICEEPISGIRYNCLDCEEYDLCGYCCEKIVMKQKGSDLSMCQDVDHPKEHTFQTIGDENCDTYSCNVCKEKIRGYRYVDPAKEDYDLCTICFYKALKEESTTPFERYDLFGNNCIDALFDEFCKKLLLKELKDIYTELGEDYGNLPKKGLSEELVNILEEKKDENKRPFLSKLVSLLPRLCCKDGEGNILPESACDALVHTLEVVANNEKVSKPPKKKTKCID